MYGCFTLLGGMFPLLGEYGCYASLTWMRVQLEL